LGIAAKSSQKNSKFYYRTSFNANSKKDLTEIWDSFSRDGILLNNGDKSETSKKGEELSAAIAVKSTVKAGEKIEIVFGLAWHAPIIRFNSGKSYHRRYTQFYGIESDTIENMLYDAINNYKDWIQQIYSWQKDILSHNYLTKEYKQALFNELYYFVDGGTIWTTEDEDEFGKFAYLEGHEYLMLNTYDVHFYASFALCMLWPKLQLSLQRDIAKITEKEYSDNFKILFTGDFTNRKRSFAVPHDVGNPGEDPWVTPNSYCVQDINRWKDLNSKFVLQVLRDYIFTQDKQHLIEMWPVVKQVVQYNIENFVKNENDGMVINEGFPDQTYDAWSASGISAYCGGLWVACLKACHKICEILDDDNIDFYHEVYMKARNAYTRLYENGYYKYDDSGSKHSTSIQSDMMAGQWYAHSCGIGDIVPKEHFVSCLMKIYENNFKKYGNGEIGVVNGMDCDGNVDDTCLQSKEVWPGTCFGISAAMIYADLMKEGFDIAHSVINASYEKFGYMYQTPEAWDHQGKYRSIGYMRPLSIWAIQWAYDRKEKEE
jgi:non-lysosomal glucosylceramidase